MRLALYTEFSILNVVDDVNCIRAIDLLQEIKKGLFSDVADDLIGVSQLPKIIGS